VRVIAGPGVGGRVTGIAPSGGGDRLRAGDELCEVAQVLDGGGEVKFVTSAARTAQPQSVELRDAVEMCEQHLDLLPLAAAGLVRLGLGDIACQVACASAILGACSRL